MFNLAHASPKFNLKPIDFYFADPKTQELLQAALDGDQVAAQQWLSQGANPNEESTSPYNKIRLLHYAIAAENPQAIRILINLGADPEAVAKGFGSAFDFAITLEKASLLGVMLELRPLQTLTTREVQLAMFGAANSPTIDCLELLLQRGFPIDITDSLGNTALMDVLSAYDFDRAEWLIQRGAKVVIEDRNGVTPAYIIQNDLSRVKSGSESEQKLLNLKNLMQARGAAFPAATPAENRAKRGLSN